MCSMFASELVTRLSTHSTRWPRAISASHRCDPRNPAPPVTSEVGTRCMLVGEDAVDARGAASALLLGLEQLGRAERVEEAVRDRAEREGERDLRRSDKPAADRSRRTHGERPLEDAVAIRRDDAEPAPPRTGRAPLDDHVAA